jgi:hypothetical protein
VPKPGRFGETAASIGNFCSGIQWTAFSTLQKSLTLKGLGIIADHREIVHDRQKRSVCNKKAGKVIDCQFFRNYLQFFTIWKRSVFNKKAGKVMIANSSEIICSFLQFEKFCTDFHNCSILIFLGGVKVSVLCIPPPPLNRHYLRLTGHLNPTCPPYVAQWIG